MQKLATITLILSIFMTSCDLPQDGRKPPTEPEVPIPESAQIATFAGGCFWCMEKPFEQLDGVYEVISGYAGGEEVAPAYEEVASGSTGHRETVQVFYDPKKVTYEQLLDIFWKQIDPTDSEGQFVDRGFQYSSAIYYRTEQERIAAEASKEELELSGRFEDPIVTEILPFSTFYQAEEYHQDYHEKNPVRYGFYRNGSGRDRFLKEAWGDEKY